MGDVGDCVAEWNPSGSACVIIGGISAMESVLR